MSSFRAGWLVCVILIAGLVIVVIGRIIMVSPGAADVGLRPSDAQSGDRGDTSAGSRAGKASRVLSHAQFDGDTSIIQSEASLAYRARSVSELEELLAASEPDSPDALRLRWMAMHGCVLYGNTAQLDQAGPRASANKEHLTGRTGRAQAVRNRFWRKFCDLDVSVLYRESELAELDSEGHWRNAANPDMRVIQALKDELQQTNLPEDRERKRDQLAEIMSRTDSPVIFEQAGRLLLSSAFVRPERIHSELPGSLLFRPQHDLPMAMTLASCRIFGRCESDSLIMGHLCGVRGCESEMDIDAYLREFHSPSMVRDAYLLADILLQWRRQGPRFNE